MAGFLRGNDPPSRTSLTATSRPGLAWSEGPPPTSPLRGPHSGTVGVVVFPESKDVRAVVFAESAYAFGSAGPTF